MGAAVMAQRRGNPAALAIAGVAVMAAVLLIVRNVAHADSKHREAELVRETYKTGQCVAVEAYFSPTRGTVLVLCQMPSGGLVGGMVFRFAENGGARLLGADAYEATCFVADRAYWRRVIIRDGYWTIGGYVSIEAAFWTWLGGAL